MLFPGQGTAVGLLIGARFGAIQANLAKQKKENRQAEQRWQRSEKGLATVTKRDKALAQVQSTYDTNYNKLIDRKTELRDHYKQAKSQGIAEVSGTRGQGLKGLATSPEAKAAGGALLGGATMVATSLLVGRQPKTTEQRNQKVANRTRQATLVQAGQMKGRVQNAREQAWLNTPDGQATNEQFKADLQACQRRKSELNRLHLINTGNIEGDYELARSEFLRQHQTE